MTLAPAQPEDIHHCDADMSSSVGHNIPIRTNEFSDCDGCYSSFAFSKAAIFRFFLHVGPVTARPRSFPEARADISENIA